MPRQLKARSQNPSQHRKQKPTSPRRPIRRQKRAPQRRRLPISLHPLKHQAAIKPHLGLKQNMRSSSKVLISLFAMGLLAVSILGQSGYKPNANASGGVMVG